MKKIYEIFRNQFYAFLHTVEVLIKTKFFWTWHTWAMFWLIYGQEKEIKMGPYKFFVRGHSLFSKLTDMYVILENVSDKAYKPMGHFPSDALVIDIGAHIGGFCISAGNYARAGTVYAIEPFPDNLRLLKKNIVLNKLNNVIPFGVAISSHEGTADFYIDRLNTSAHSLTKKSRNIIKVPCLTLNDFFQKNHIQKCHFLKMDCEGGEYDIILSASMNVLKHIDTIVLEYHVPQYFGLSDTTLLKDLIHRLSEAGFTISVEPENYKRGYIRASRV